MAAAPHEEKALLLRAYVGESDRHEGQPLYKALVHLLRARGVRGATVLRGLYGYGRSSVLHAASPLRLSTDLPLVVEAVDREDVLRDALPDVAAMVGDVGVVTLERVAIVRPAPPGEPPHA